MKKILFLTGLIVFGFLFFRDVQADTQSWQVGASSDDALRRLTTSYFALTATGFKAGADSASYKQYGIGARFTNVTIPQGAIIDQAYLTLRAQTTKSATVVRTRISAEAVDDAPTFTNDAAAFDNRWANRTTARIDWDNISAWTANVDYNSSEIKTVIQEIVDRAGWASGNDIVIFWEDFEDRSDKSPSDSHRSAYSKDGSPAYAPKLVVTYNVPTIPTVTTQAASSVGATTATGNGNITNIGGETVTQRGFEWGISSGNYPNSATDSGTFGTGAYTKSLTGLPSGTTIYYRAKAYNVIGWGYGGEQGFTTLTLAPPPPSIPTVTTQAASSVGATTATGNGNITNIGGETVTQRGFEWGISSGNYPNSATDSGTFGTGAYTKSLTGLPSGTTIYYRAKAYNVIGWGYGGEQGFTTLTLAPPPPCESHNVSGYAWSENIGWVSFSCGNTMIIGEGVDYGVDISTSTGEFSGYAWSENIGWIDFAPGDSYPNIPNYSACLDFPGAGQVCDDLPGSNKIGGWARALAHGDGWDGWIKLRGLADDGSPYGVDFSTPSGELSGYAWGSDVVGAVSFNCADGGYDEATGAFFSVCGVSDYKVVTTARQPPSVSTDGETWFHCSYKGKSIPTLHWNYFDGTQVAYWIQVDDTSAGFPNPEIDTGWILSSSESYVADSYDFAWNEKYWWRIKVKNQAGVESQTWAGANFTTNPHAHPYPDFTWDPAEPTQGEVVIFDPDASETFGGTGISGYQWAVTEGDGTFVDSTSEFSQYPHIIFNTATNKVTLEVTDTYGYSCNSSEKEITAQLPLPEYKEVPPIIWLKKALLAVAKFFNGWF